MVNKIFIFLFILGLGYGLFTNRSSNVINELLNAPKGALMVFIEIYILLVFWGGILRIMKDNGLLDIVSKGISFIIHPLFKRLDRNSDALKYISMNLVANMLSMGSAATPFGLLAMKELDKINNHSDTASDEMITFLVINTSGLCLIPTTLLAIRTQFESGNPTTIVPYILIVSVICTVCAITLDMGVRKFARG